jgi:hypothetical protein
MKINDIDVLITKVEAKKNKDGADYITINFLDILSGDNFDIISKNLEHMKLKPMTKYSVSLNLSSSKYGIKLELEKIGKELGGIV